MDELRPLVGIGVMILKNGMVLLGKRKGAYGAGEYSFPGGNLEYRESIFDCATRETKEECGVSITNLKLFSVTNYAHQSPKHYITLNVIAEWGDGEPSVLEPAKAENWEWYNLDNLPEPLFTPTKLFIKSYTENTFHIEA